MMPDPFHAHTPNDRGEWHGLRQHLDFTAALARQMAGFFSAGDLGYWAGLVHDIGKAAPAFQQYLYACSTSPASKAKSVAHSTPGALWASQQGADFLAFVLAGHHGGLPNTEDLRARIKDVPESLKRSLEVLKLAVDKGLLPNPVVPLTNLLPAPLQRIPQDPLRVEMFIRMLFSALVDADFLDTESHFAPTRMLARRHELTIVDLWECLRTSQDRLSEFQSTPAARRAWIETASLF